MPDSRAPANYRNGKTSGNRFAEIQAVASAGQKMEIGGALSGKISAPAAATLIADSWRQDGLRIVHAHGVFDLLHPGHVRYLNRAKTHGDRLIVSVTSNEFATKAPGRPVFSEDLRAEMLAALDCVDAVVINNAATATELIEKIKPDVYAKGNDYANGKGYINVEREAVERNGGKLIFTNEKTFSSSELINRHIAIGTEEAREYLAHARKNNYRERAEKLLTAAADLSVLFIGETIIDEYIYVSPLGKPPKEFVIATLEHRREKFNGGILAAQAHAGSFNLETRCFSKRTITKTRHVDQDRTRKLFETYTMKNEPASKHEESCWATELEKICPNYDVVVVIDFGHGMMTQKLREVVRAKSKFLAVNAQSNSANHGFNPVTSYGADYLCVDAPEARLAYRNQWAELNDCAEHLLKHAPRLVITDGHRGSLAHQSGWPEPKRIPAFADKIVDTMGAGDAFLAVTAPLVALSDDIELIAFIGNIVGGIKVGTIGHRKPVDKKTVLQYIDTLLR